MPWLGGQRGENESDRHRPRADGHHEARSEPVDEPADPGGERDRGEESEREDAGGESPRPAGLVEDRRDRREKAVRLLAPMPMVTIATATTTQP